MGRTVPHLFLLFLIYGRNTDRNLIRQLREGDAVDAESAVPLGRPLGTVESRRLARLVERGIVVQTRDRRFYLDQVTWMALHEKSRRAVNVFLVGMLAVWLLSVLFG
jgi:CHASE1-domain containing sensor protein